MVKRTVYILICLLMLIPASGSICNAAASDTVSLYACDWPPYTGAALDRDGFLSDIAVRAFNSVGYQVEVYIEPWKRAFEIARGGYCDALLGASYTEERETFFHYPNYYWESSQCFFVLKGSDRRFTTVEDLCPATVGILHGSFYEERFRGIGCIQLDPAPTVLLNIKKLIGRRFDYLLESRDAVNYILKHQLPDCADAIVPLLPPYEEDRIYLVFPKKRAGYRKLSDDFDRGITLIQKNGLYQKILERHGIR